ncbi:cyclin-dependent kinase G-2 [Nicotiana tabacum]|uniref:cyclin-dependent kinase n=1 Tax=Nicotiana tabacum TaxID=4097 RepID=A0A1S4D6N0_TOBAC|nr:PREDICTED: cyclin-dependent kinase G-2-like [Nicotiana tabacum]
MAAGRHGGYRDDEFRGQGLEFEVSRREVGYSKRNYDGFRNGDSGVRLRRMNLKEREMMSNSGRSDREPGELSSSSESVSDDQASNSDNGDQLPVQSKIRKFSPVIWDNKDAKKVNRMSNISTISLVAAKVQNYSMTNNNTEQSQLRVKAIPVSHQVTSEFPDHISLTPPVEVRSSNEQEAKILEHDEYVHIRASRWVTDVDDFPVDDNKIPRLKSRKLGSWLTETGGRRKSLTPELGNPKKNRAQSSESDDHIRSSSRDSYQENNLDKNDSMDVDKDRNYDDTSVSQSDTEYEHEHDSCGVLEASFPPQRSVNMLQGCRSVDEYERLNKIDEGTYGVVYRARDKKTGEIVALKKVKMEKEREGFPLTSLREINILLSFYHPAVVDVKEVVVGSKLDNIFMVMEYMEHDLKALMETMKQRFTQSEVKCLMLQLLEGVKYLHDNWVLHRDLKTSNLLLNNQGELKICDFGLARQYGSPLKTYTQLVVTLWYRAPELLLGAKQYSTAIDMWSLGCIMAELLRKEPLFNGKSEVDQLNKIFRILGTPNETIWPGFSKLPGVKVNFVKHKYNLLRKEFPATSFMEPGLSDAGFDLLNKLLTYDPDQRITAEAALNHEWFREVPLPKSKEFMPTFPAQHAQDRRTRRVVKSPDPLEEQRRKELQQGELGTGGLFC